MGSETQTANSESGKDKLPHDFLWGFATGQSFPLQSPTEPILID